MTTMTLVCSCCGLSQADVPAAKIHPSDYESLCSTCLEETSKEVTPVRRLSFALNLTEEDLQDADSVSFLYHWAGFVTQYMFLGNNRFGPFEAVRLVNQIDADVGDLGKPILWGIDPKGSLYKKLKELYTQIKGSL